MMPNEDQCGETIQHALPSSGERFTVPGLYPDCIPNIDPNPNPDPIPMKVGRVVQLYRPVHLPAAATATHLLHSGAMSTVL